MPTLKIPDGVVTHDDYATDYLVVGINTVFATIDWRNRCFRVGMSVSGRVESKPNTYKGRGWQQRIVDDAIAWLKAL